MIASEIVALLVKFGPIVGPPLVDYFMKLNPNQEVSPEEWASLKTLIGTEFGTLWPK